MKIIISSLSIAHHPPWHCHLANVETRIDTQLSRLATQNVTVITAILPHIVEAVLFCARQHIGFRCHRNDKTYPLSNSILRVARKTLVTQAKRYKIRWYKWLPILSVNTSILSDETTSHRKEILSVCLRLLNSSVDPTKPQKRRSLDWHAPSQKNYRERYCRSD